MAMRPEEESPQYAFIDTNPLLRVLLDDLPEQAEATVRLLDQAAAGQIRLRTSVLVVAELVWVLRSFYKLPRAGIRDRILSLLQSPGLEVAEADLLLVAINDFAEKNVGFIEAYNAAWAKKHGITDVYTFDRRHYSRFPGVRVLAPK